MKIPTNKFITNLGLAFGISLLTAFFVLIIQFLSSNFVKNEGELSFDEIIDTENIHGYIIVDTSEFVNNNAQLDRLVSDEELDILNEDGFVRVDDFTDSTNAVSFSIEKLFVDFSSSQYSEFFGETKDRGMMQVRFKTESELPYIVKLCGSAKTETPCNIKMKNEDNAQTSNLNISLKNTGKESYLLLEQFQVDEELADSSLRFVGKGAVELEVASLK